MTAVRARTCEASPFPPEFKLFRSTVSVIGSLILIGCDASSTRGAAEQAAARQNSANSACRVLDAGRPLPEEVRETSGLARSQRNPALFWTHNDKGNDADLFALDSQGRLVQRVRVSGAAHVDWEDLEAGPCDAGACLFVGDIGDNNAARENITVYRVPEPEAGADRTVTASALSLRFPDGPQDAEALFVLPSRDLFVVTKGRHGPIALYRYPASHPVGALATLEKVRELFPKPADDADRVTAATASRDGRWVGVRTATTLYVYDGNALVNGRAVEPLVVDLTVLQEIQGEALVIENDGTVWLTSEAENRRERPSWSRLKCTLPN